MATGFNNRRVLLVALWLCVLATILFFADRAYRNVRENRERSHPPSTEVMLPESKLFEPAEGKRQRDRARALLNAAPPKGSEQALWGTVVDEVSNPVPDASVALLQEGEGDRPLEVLIREGRFTLTDEEGRFSFFENPPQVANGATYTVVVRHPGFRMASQQANVDGEPVTIILPAGLAIRGRVVQGLVRTERGVAHVRVAARSTGAGVAAARSDVFASVGALVQSTLTSQDGFFELRGLAPGIYQVDVVSPGLVPAPTTSLGGRLGLQMRATRERAGAADVVIRVVPLVLGMVRVEDEKRGTPIAGARLSLSLPEGWSHWPKDIVNSYQHVVANGRSISIDSIDLPPGGIGFLLIPDRWPLPSGTAVKAVVSADDYEEGQVEALVWPAGEVPVSSEDVTLVRLRSAASRSIARFVLEDASANPVGPVGLTLRCTGERTGTSYVQVVFDRDGKSQPVALLADEYREISAAPHPVAGPIARTKQDRFDLTEDLAHPIVLRLQASGLFIEPIDESGNVIDDVAIRVGTGHRPVQVEYKRVGGVITWEGAFLRRPGLGEWTARPILGATPGLCTVEAYRHGYESARLFTRIPPGGGVKRVVIRLKANPEAEWDNWNKQARNDLDDVSNAD